MREIKLVASVVLFLFGASGLMAQGAGKMAQQTIKGTVEMACPQGKMLRVSTSTPGGSETKTLSFAVMPDCPSALKEQIQNLKKGSSVTVTYFQCPKTKKLVVTQIEQESSNAK